MSKSIHDYPKLDLSPLVGARRRGVICRSEEEAVWLLAALKDQYPKCCRTWLFPNVRWYTNSEYQEYFPNIDNGVLRFASSKWGTYNGHEMIEFSTLHQLVELEPFDPVDLPLTFLFGGDDDG